MTKLPSLSIEECKELYFDKNVLIYPNRKLRRLHGSGIGRYYYEQIGNSIQYFISLTNLIASTMPTPEPLKKWIADMGYEESRQYAQERADYGTFMHIKFHELLINRKLDLDSIDSELKAYLEVNKLEPYLFDEWIEEMKKDIVGFAQFLIDYKVRPLAIEIVLASEDGFAGALDLICLLTIEEKGFFGEVYKSGERKGEPKETKREKEVFALVDFKSGRKNFYENHEIQLEGCRRLFKENFPRIDVKDLRLFNYSPNEWRTVPGYKLKDQTDCLSRDKFEHLVHLARIEMKKRERMVLKIEGMLDLDKPVSDCYREMTMDELILEQQKEETE